MKKPTYKLKISICTMFLVCMMLVGCGSLGSTNQNSSGNQNDQKAIATAAGDYYLDLSELGMNLTIYLRLSEDGSFQFSNTTDFEVNKSSGIFQMGTEDYLMIYETVNGEEKSISDGLTSNFFIDDDGNLDFTHCEKIYYGSASATTTGDSADAKLIAVPIPEDYQAPDTTSEFAIGTYVAQVDIYQYTASFYVDNTYLLIKSWSENGEKKFISETGSYGVNASQLALTPNNGTRISCDVMSASELSLSVPSASGSSDRESLCFKKQEIKELTAKLTGTGTVTGTTDTFDVTVSLYSDGSYTSTADGFTENGIFVPDSSAGVFKTYPDHSETRLRGLNQVSTVPSGTLCYENTKLKLEGFRVRNSENLTRYKCDLTEE